MTSCCKNITQFILSLSELIPQKAILQIKSGRHTHTLSCTVQSLRPLLYAHTLLNRVFQMNMTITLPLSHPLCSMYIIQRDVRKHKHLTNQKIVSFQPIVSRVHILQKPFKLEMPKIYPTEVEMFLRKANVLQKSKSPQSL